MYANEVVGLIDEEMPIEVMERAKEAALELLPAKSAAKYNRAYKIFKEWQTKNGVASVSSDVIIAYFHYLNEKKYKPTSLWAYYSMLKSTLKAYENIDIGGYHQVAAFLKNKSIGYKCVKAKVFLEAEIQKFIDEAEDLGWLDVKVSKNRKFT